MTENIWLYIHRVRNMFPVGTQAQVSSEDWWGSLKGQVGTVVGYDYAGLAVLVEIDGAKYRVIECYLTAV